MKDVYDIRFRDMCRMVVIAAFILLVVCIQMKTAYAATDLQQPESTVQKMPLDQPDDDCKYVICAPYIGPIDSRIHKCCKPIELLKSDEQKFSSTYYDYDKRIAHCITQTICKTCCDADGKECKRCDCTTHVVCDYSLEQSELPSAEMNAAIKNSLPNIKFNDKHSSKKTIKDISVEFATAFQAESGTQKRAGQGFLFGKFITNKRWALGTVASASLAPGTYFMWVEKQNMEWKAFVTDAEGNFLASTNEVKIMTKNTNKEPSLSELKGLEAHILVPNYSLSTAKGKVSLLADEGPGTVHGCQCHTVMDCGHSLSCYTLCIPTRVCSCWN